MCLCIGAAILSEESTLNLFTESNEKNFNGNSELPQISILDCALEKICRSAFITSVLRNTVVLSLPVCCQQQQRYDSMTNIKDSMVNCLGRYI